MKKYIAFLILGIILLGTTVFAETTQITDVQDFVKNVIKTKGIDDTKVTEITEMNFQDLPEEINLQNIDETNLALYQVQVTGEEKPVYIITASDTKIKKTIKEFAQKMLLVFGQPEVISETAFLKNAVGVLGSQEKGYVMIRQGSITGLSTNLEAIDGAGKAEIIIYKNGEEFGFRNTFTIEDTNTYEDYDSISPNVLTFEKGDLISVKIVLSGNIQIRDITTLLEIETK
jgi:hypothetical protein